MDHGRRGINVVNAGETATNGVRTRLDIFDNVIEFSQFEGIYIVNTTVEAQGTGTNIDNNADVAMLTSDSAVVDPRLALNIVDNLIRANGQNGNDGNFIGDGTEAATGLVLRVSTSDATTLGQAGTDAYETNGDDVSTANVFATNLTDATFTGNVATANMVRGGVGANIDGNTFIGQLGSDVTFQPFVSVSSLPTTGGTWTDQNETPRVPGNDVFDVTSYTQDPLARLDLRFVNNTGDGAIVTRQDSIDAFFSNAETVFKSRPASQDGADPPGTGVNVGDDGGPFTTATRRRNATRLAGNTGIFNRPTGVGTIVDVSANGFLYPGVAGSTFRRTSDSDFNNGGNANTNIFTTVSGDFTLAVPFSGAVTGELPFIWATMP
jgi:hypothetical protein